MRIVFVILHKLILLGLGLYWLGEYVLTKLREFLNGNRSDLAADKRYIEHHIRNLDKVPLHLAVLMGEEDPQSNVLARFILWVAAAGVDHVTIYDHKGSLGHVKDKIRSDVDCAKDGTDQIIWGEDFNAGKPIPHKNGYKRRLIVNFFDPAVAGRGLLVQACRSVAQDVRDGRLETVSMDLVDKRLRKLFSGLPDPDLALYFGAVCGTYGLSPWHLRLTEFIGLPRQTSLKSVDLVHALYRFSRCEQRFGK